MKIRRGLTLLELLLVMVIIAILVGGLIVTFGCGIRARAWKTKGVELLGTTAIADAAYFQEQGEYCGDPQELVDAPMQFLKNNPDDDANFTVVTDGAHEWTATKDADPFGGSTVVRDSVGSITYTGWTCT